MANLLASHSPAQELVQLRDIHLPEPIGWWPLASGWYLLAVLMLISLIIVIFFAIRYYINGRAKRQAIHLLTDYQQQYRQDNGQLIAARISELLKRVALVYFPREKVASLQGDEWIAFLTNTSKGLNFEKVRIELLDMPYQPALSKDLSLLIKMVRNWIKQRRGKCLN